MAMLSSQRRNDTRDFKPRYAWFIAAVALVFTGLGLRLWHLQVDQGERYARLSTRNFVQAAELPHSRGMLLDRRGHIVADNRPSYDLYVTPAFVEDRGLIGKKLRDVLGLDRDVLTHLQRILRGARGLGRFKPILLVRDISREQLARFESNQLELGGIKVEVRPYRNYRYGELSGHVLGYMNEISRGELDKRARKGYRRGDFIGRRGIERLYETELRGKDGWEKVVVDAKGRPVQGGEAAALLSRIPDRRKEAVPGHNVVLSLDLELQQIMEKAFTGTQGAAVALDPRTGYIRAIMSEPGFDPNLLSGRISREEKQRLDKDPLEPWINKAIQNHYAPGSTYKVVAALAALNEGHITTNTKVFCPGYYRLGRRSWRCHRAAGHGKVNVHRALQVSCDTFFYDVGLRVGMDKLAEYAQAMGFGERSGLGLGTEVAGIVPSVGYHERYSPDGFQRGFILNTSIGQGDVNVTPLQLAVAYAAVANGGKVYQPQLVERVETAGGDIVKSNAPKLRMEMDVDAQALREVVKGLTMVVNERGGTAYWRRPKDVDVRIAGKTGTAQVIRLGDKREKTEEMAYFERDHAWFGAFAPAEEPRLVVVVLNEHGGHGGSGAAPIAMEVLRGWFNEVEPELGMAPGGLEGMEIRAFAEAPHQHDHGPAPSETQ